MNGKLYIVPTPIGNLEDITLRAIKCLSEVDLILAEDTRTSKKMLNHFQIKTSLQSYHLHNEHNKTQHYISIIKDQHKNVALISDAGTPAISDPGYLLVKSAIENQVDIECLPGATAFVPSLVISGMALHEFLYIGFLPQKKGRHTKLKNLSQERRTIVMYESPHKLLSTLESIIEFFGNYRRVSISRELTKIYEETIRGSALEVYENFSKRDSIKGEFVIVIEGNMDDN